MKYIFFFVVLIRIANAIHAEKNDVEEQIGSGDHLVVVCGQDGYGDERDNPLQYLFDTSNFKKNIHYVKTPIAKKGHYFTGADFGQRNCQYYLHDVMQKLEKNSVVERIFIYAISQGTSTTIQYLNENTCEKVKALIFEGVMASGNSAISHFSANKIHLYFLGKKVPIGRWFSWMPFSFYTMPYIASPIVYPWYSIGGNQAILSLNNIPNVPIILMHSTKDRVLTHDDAIAIYSGLRYSGTARDNVYLLTSNQDTHVELLNEKRNKSDSEEIKTFVSTIHHILGENGFNFPKPKGFREGKVIEQSLMQPDGDQALVEFYLRREQTTRFLNRTLIAHAIFGLTHLFFGQRWS